MDIEIISTGTELLNGKVNTDDAFICEKLASIGLSVSRLITVGDSMKDMKLVLEESLKRADMVFTIGGLGPTFDDLTREAVAGVLRKKLIFDRQVMHQIAAHFAKRDLDMPVNNEKQAYIIEGAKVLPNSFGTAPGMVVENEGAFKKTVILFPGPPKELIPMFEDYAMPYLKSRYEKTMVKTSVLHVCGLTESAVYEKVQSVVETEREMEGNELVFAILAERSIVDIKIMGKGDDELLIDNMMHKARQEIYDCLGDDIYGENMDTLEGIAGRLLGKKRMTLSIAESCTGGMISSRITDVPGSSMYFKQGFITYSNDSKIGTLGVSENTLKNHGAVSRATAGEMAVRAREISGSDVGLATTGIAGPTGGTRKKPLGMVYIAISKNDDVLCNEYRFTGARLEIKARVVNTALDLLRRHV